MEEKRDPTFAIRWTWVLVGFLLGIFAPIAVLFAAQDRRDKMYSTLLGTGISMAVNLAVLWYQFG
jgi:hypothetical protein